MRTPTVDVCLPTHPTLTHPRTGEPLRAVGMSRRGPIWPVLGGDGTDNGGGQQAGQNGAGQGGTGQSGSTGAGGQTGGQQGSQGGGTGTSDDRGYPANTPVADMTAEQQTAYWRFHARKHENAYKGLGLTPGNEAAELQQLREAQADLQKRKNVELSDVERLTKERDEFAVKAQELQIAKIRADAASAAGLPADMAEFITAVEADMAKQQAETLKSRMAPGTPGSSDQGTRRQTGTAGGSAAGLAEAKRRFGDKRQTTQT